MEISCTVGFKLDNLLVGLRTQLVLKHHTTLNSILKGGKSSSSSPLTPVNSSSSNSRQRTTAKVQQGLASNNKSNKSSSGRNATASGNILVRFYKRYVMDDYEQDFDCDNFSKL